MYRFHGHIFVRFLIEFLQGPIADGSVEVSEDGNIATLHCNSDHVLQSSLTQSQVLVCDNSSWSWSPGIFLSLLSFAQQPRRIHRGAVNLFLCRHCLSEIF